MQEKPEVIELVVALSKAIREEGGHHFKVEAVLDSIVEFDLSVVTEAQELSPFAIEHILADEKGKENGK